MNILRIGIIQRQSTASIEDNKKCLFDAIVELSELGARLIVLPELHNTLYFCQEENPDNFSFAETIPGPSTEFFGKLACEKEVTLVLSLFERRAVGLYHNSAVVIDIDGKIKGVSRKMHIPDDPGYYEKYYFTPGDTGFYPIKTSVGMLGVMTCWDQWFPEAARLMAIRGAQILIYPTAIGYDCREEKEICAKERSAWMLVQRGHAVANGLHLVAVNRIGYEKDPSKLTKGQNFWGSSFIAGPQGELLYVASEDQEERRIIDIDLDKSEQIRQQWPFFRDRRIDFYSSLVARYDDETEIKRCRQEV